jgi:hypothetical protein
MDTMIITSKPRYYPLFWLRDTLRIPEKKQAHGAGFAIGYSMTFPIHRG